MTFPKNILLISACALVTSACQTVEQLSRINDLPPITQIQNPTAHPNYRPVTMPMPSPEEPQTNVRHVNSLWQPGARAFFKDQRAHRVGDILTVNININDTADITNTTTRSRETGEKFGAENLFGLETQLTKVLPEGVDPAKLVGISNKPTHKGTGTIKRTEKINMKFAASIVQVLPNGNLVVAGRQETRVNYEVREMVLTGIVRPEDISSANTIPYEKIAEARISYGGRGQINDMQQPPYGQQILNALSPF
tara:strand:- start:79 stop:834 length:756 start_codon:yes stop_codon:yes gene_type:complete